MHTQKKELSPVLHVAHSPCSQVCGEGTPGAQLLESELTPIPKASGFPSGCLIAAQGLSKCPACWGFQQCVGKTVPVAWEIQTGPQFLRIRKELSMFAQVL